MSQFMRCVVASFVLALCAAVSVDAQATRPSSGTQVSVICSAEPVDAQMHRFPFASGPLITSQGVGLGLTPKYLRYPLQAYNHHRELATKACPGGIWVPEIIPAGTLVWVDEKGYVAYKHDCGNRLVYNGPLPAPVPTTASPAPPDTRTWLGRRWDGYTANLAYWWNWPFGRRPQIIEVKATGNADLRIVQ